jgi:outer membrane protein, heavy metal efflux system
MWVSPLGRVQWLMIGCLALARTFSPSYAGAQLESRNAAVRADSGGLDSLISRAIAVSSTIIAARHRVDAARARIGPSGARPDPMLMAGIQNQPLGRDAPMTSPQGATNSGPDPMTMHMIGVSQTIPYPGKLALRTQAAEREVDAATAALDNARLNAMREVRSAYYELAYLDQALRITQQNQGVLSSIVRVTESHYAVGSGMQQDVLKARLAITQLAQSANTLREQRQAQLAALNAFLDRAGDTPVESARIPERIARAAVPDSADRIRFASNVFGAPAADSPLAPLAALQATAIENNAMLREHEARIGAQTARVALAERATRPDIDVSLQYGQRSGLTDMVSAIVSVPIPIQRHRKQDEDVAATRAELAALEAEHHATVNDLRARIAKLYADLERQRTQLALDVKAILPQGRAALAATTASYQAGKTDILTLLDSQSVLFTYETSYYRALSDFAETLAELENVVGKEVLP